MIVRKQSEWKQLMMKMGSHAVKTMMHQMEMTTMASNQEQHHRARRAMEDTVKNGGNLPTIYINDIVGRTFITLPDTTGEQVREQIERASYVHTTTDCRRNGTAHQVSMQGREQEIRGDHDVQQDATTMV